MKKWFEYDYLKNFGDVYSWSKYPVNGTDIPMPTDTQVTAPFAGVITDIVNDRSGINLVIKIDDPSKSHGIPFYGFSHLDAIDLSFGINTHVAENQFLGWSGGQLPGQSIGQLPPGYMHHYTYPEYSNGPHLMLFLSHTSYLLNQTNSDLTPYWVIDYIRRLNGGYVSSGNDFTSDNQKYRTQNKTTDRNYIQLDSSSTTGDIFMNIDKSLILFNPFENKQYNVTQIPQWTTSFLQTLFSDISPLILRLLLISLGVFVIYESMNISFDILSVKEKTKQIGIKSIRSVL